MMKRCPDCFSSLLKQESLGEPLQEIHLDICNHCGLVWLEFGEQRPALYQKLENQVKRWEKQTQARHLKDQIA